jgi:hypothetical protein
VNPEPRTLRVGALTRVEGEGALRVTLSDGAVDTAELNIYEPPRFFEAFLRGRSYTEPPDITARICGICPVAYQVSACNAIEDACGVTVDPDLVALRRLLYCGEWIHSHALHIYLLHAPDFLGYPDAISLAKDHSEFVKRGSALKKAGNRLMQQLGGRAIHLINVRLGGFYSVPTPNKLKPLSEMLQKAMDDALYTVRAVAEFDFPDLTFDHKLLALTDLNRYAIEDGVIARSAGPGLGIAEFREHGTVNLSNPRAIFAGSPPRFTRSRVRLMWLAERPHDLKLTVPTPRRPPPLDELDPRGPWAVPQEVLDRDPTGGRTVSPRRGGRLTRRVTAITCWGTTLAAFARLTIADGGCTVLPVMTSAAITASRAMPR